MCYPLINDIPSGYHNDVLNSTHKSRIILIIVTGSVKQRISSTCVGGVRNKYTVFSLLLVRFFLHS